MSSIQYPEHHKNDVWNVPDRYYHKSLGLLLGGRQAAKFLGCCKEILYRDADDLDLTVLRRNLLHGGRYFLVSELEALIRERQKLKGKLDRKAFQKIGRRN